MNTGITNDVKATSDNAQYDACAKRLLANKSILGHILVNTIDEFNGMSAEEAATYIEGDPLISIVPVDPGLTNAEKTDVNGQHVVGLNTESTEINEGMIRYDIIFYVRMRDGLSQIIVNIEAQKDEPTKYDILNRAIFYTCRMVSSQKDRDFVNTNYNDIKQVFSIWICMNMERNALSHICLTKKELLEPYKWKGNLNLLNIIMIGVTNEIPERGEKYELHRLISTLLSSDLPGQKKLDIMEHEYSIPIKSDIREDVNTMCNLSEGIEEKGMKKGLKEQGTNMILNVMNLHDFTFDAAADFLGVTGPDREDYRKAIAARKKKSRV